VGRVAQQSVRLEVRSVPENVRDLVGHPVAAVSVTVLVYPISASSVNSAAILVVRVIVLADPAVLHPDDGRPRRGDDRGNGRDEISAAVGGCPSTGVIELMDPP